LVRRARAIHWQILRLDGSAGGREMENKALTYFGVKSVAACKEVRVKPNP
jgi:hypothetical protein